MKNNLFDSYIKEQLGGYRPEVPSHIWDNIAAESSKRKPIGFWQSISAIKKAGFVILLLVTLGSLTYLISNNKVLPAYAASDKNTRINYNSPSVVKQTDIHTFTSPADPVEKEPSNFLQRETILTAGSPVVPTDNYNTISRAGKLSINIANSPFNNEGVQITPENTGNSSLFPYNSFFSVLHSGSAFTPQLKMPLLPAPAFIPCPEQDAAGNKRYIEVYAGPDYAFLSYSDTANSAYMQQRKASTKLAFAYSAGLRYTKVFGSGMSIRTGINYSQVNETFNSVKGQETRNVYITNTTGDTIGTSTVTGTLYKQSTNIYRSIDIPLTVGYELGNGKLHANVNAGAIVNLYSKKTGFVLDNSGQAVDVNSDKTAPAYRYKTNTGISVTGAVSLYYKLNEKLHVLAEPYVRYSLSPVTKPDLTLKEKYHSAGLRVGLRMDLP